VVVFFTIVQCLNSYSEVDIYLYEQGIFSTWVMQLSSLSPEVVWLNLADA